jgi:group I intron endonuclease
MTAGIYKITSKITHKVYVGESHNLSHRISRHKTELKYGTHNNPYLQRHTNKYGLDDLIFDLIEELPPAHDILLEREAYWINFFESNNYTKGFNLNKGGQGGYATTFRHKNFILVNIKEGKEYFFRTVTEFEDSMGVSKSPIRDVLLNKKSKTWCGWTTPFYYKHIIHRIIHKQLEKIKPRKKPYLPSNSKYFRLKNLETGEVITDKNIFSFSQKNCLCYNSLLRVIRGERKQHKNWICIN